MNQKFGFYFPDAYSVSCSQGGKDWEKTLKIMYLSKRISCHQTNLCQTRLYCQILKIWFPKENYTWFLSRLQK